MTPRPYQQKAFDIIKQTLNIKKTFLLQAPCAAGKTFIFSMLSDWLYKNDRNVLILLDRENLVSQTAKKILDYQGFASNIGIVCATASKEKNINPITIASRQTLHPMLKNGLKMKLSLLILDEVHLCNPDFGQYFEIIQILKLQNSNMRIFGCDATPFRIKGGYIFGEGKLFDRLDYRITTKELIENNYIVPLRWKAREDDINDQLNNLKTGNTGELIENEQYDVLKSPVFIESVYDAYSVHCENKKTAIFALNIAHAELIQECFKKNNIDSFIVHSRLTTNEVHETIERFQKLQTGIIINVGILTIGSDIPSIQAVILARRTLSTALFFQIIGRGGRPYKNKKECLIIDLCGNWALHGIDPDNPILIYDKNNKKTATQKLCPMCEELVAINTRICKVCGFEFPKTEENNSVVLSEKHGTGRIIDLSSDPLNTKIEIDHIHYKQHWKDESKPPTVWARFCKDGKCIANKWFCPQHPAGSFPQKQAEIFWREMWGKNPIPKTVEEFVGRADELSTNCEIVLRKTGKYPEIIEIKNTLF